jgi:hypothetical protein
MSFWNGTDWDAVEEVPSPRGKSRMAHWISGARLVLALGALLIPLGSAAAASHRYSDPPCTISASSAAVGETYVVSIAGLPTGIAINLWITDATGTTGSPLGSTGDGTFNLNESSKVAGVTTYTFSGPTKVRNTVIYSSCSVVAS